MRIASRARWLRYSGKVVRCVSDKISLPLDLVSSSTPATRAHSATAQAKHYAAHGRKGNLTEIALRLKRRRLDGRNVVRRNFEIGQTRETLGKSLGASGIAWLAAERECPGRRGVQLDTFRMKEDLKVVPMSMLANASAQHDVVFDPVQKFGQLQFTTVAIISKRITRPLEHT